MNFYFWRKNKKTSYSEKKRELEVRDELYSRMSSLSDNQMEKWVKTRLELEELRQNGNIVRMIK